MSSMRTKGKSTIVWILMGMLLLGLGGFGVTNFSGGASSAVATVGKTEITAQDYARVLQTNIRNFEAQTGQRIDIDTTRRLGLTTQAQAQLVSAAALGEEARRIGLSVGDERIAQTILEAPAFQDASGQFDRARYQDALGREGLTEAEFEADLREDEARLILNDAATSGVSVPQTQVDQAVRWMLETRDFRWVEMTPAQLSQAVADPGDETLQGWHTANAARFTAPEQRKISYALVTPEMLAPQVDLDEAALREIYDARIDEYQQPERRLVSRLVFESTEAASAARARLDAGEVDFEALAAERGLSLADTDLGELRQADLGPAGEAVFAPADNGIVGPTESELGPALFSVNAILDPVDVSFEAALPDLRAEAAEDRARRLIADRAGDIQDLLAGGATLEDLAAETDMELGQIDWQADATPEHGSIAAYPAFRDAAAALEVGAYPELHETEDGGLFALRLDELVEPTLRPFDEVRGEVLADWTRAETHRLLLAAAERTRLALMAEEAPAPADATPPAPPPELNWSEETGMLRDGYLEFAPRDLLARAFEIEAGEIAVVDSEGRVALVELRAVGEPDADSEAARNLRTRLASQLDAGLQRDVFDYFTRALQIQNGLTLDQSALRGVEAQIR